MDQPAHPTLEPEPDAAPNTGAAATNSDENTLRQFSRALLHRRAYTLLVATALTMGSLALITSFALGYPVRDPDGFLGPGWLRLPLLLGGAFIVDVVPRTLYRARMRPRRFGAEARQLLREHWSRERVILVVVGLISFYVTYVSYRNLKNFLPFIRRGDVGPPTKYDYALQDFDEWLLFGHAPATVLHRIFGVDLWAHILSYIYLFFLPMVPIVIVVWAVWSRNISVGYWFITAQCLSWSLGTLSYYLIPTMGPNFFFPWLYSDLPETGVARLQDALFYGRQKILFNPFADGVQSVAGFASLHVAISLAVALVAHYTVRSVLMRTALWVFVALTMVATIYFGWHYLTDDVAGVAIAVFSVYVAGLATGQKFDRYLRTATPTTATSDISVRATIDPR